jgi:hypothetical protein
MKRPSLLALCIAPAGLDRDLADLREQIARDLSNE